MSKYIGQVLIPCLLLLSSILLIPLSSNLLFSYAEQPSSIGTSSSGLKRESHPPIIIENQQDLEDYHFPGNGTLDNPYRIENYEIIYESGYDESAPGIGISGTTSYIVIKNNYIEGFDEGIVVIDTEFYTIKIEGNELVENKSGIKILATKYQEIVNNVIINNGESSAICLYYSRRIKVQYNTITNSGWIGLNTGNDVHYCEFSYNTVEGSGALVPEPDDTHFVHPYGIRLSGLSSNNLVHHNNFVDNNPKGDSQGMDDGEDNIWFDEETNEGSFWSDWEGYSEYGLKGSAGNNDPYPLKKFLNYSNPYETGENLSLLTLLFLLLPSIIIQFCVRKKRKTII